VRSALDHAPTPGAEDWSVVNWDNLKNVFASYREDRRHLEIVGLPLLAHLSLRLLAQWQGGPEQLLSDRTALYVSATHFGK
jgi:hypothetical protein